MPRPPFARRAVSVYDRAALGIYKGPLRRTAAPRLTAHRRRVLEAISLSKVHLGKGQHVHGFRWNDSGAMTTVTRTVNEFIACGWAHVVKSHVELTGAGREALDG